MKQFKDLSIAKKLVTLFVAVTVILAVGAGYFIIRFSTRYLISQIKVTYADNVSDYMATVDMLMAERYHDIRAFAHADTLTRGTSTPEEITEWLKIRKEIYGYASLSYFDMNRIRVADTEGMDIGKQHDMAGYWEDVLNGRVSAGSDVRIAEGLKIPIIYFASPVKNKEGKAIGVVVARDDGRNISLALQNMAKVEVETLDATLFDKDRNIIFSTCEVLKNWILKEKIPQSPSVEAVLGGQDGAIMGSLPYEKGEYITAYAHERGYGDFKGNDWSLILMFPKTQALAPVEKLRNSIIGIFLGAVLVICVTGSLFSRSISKPILRLAEVVKKFGKGDLTQKAEVAAHDEIGELAGSFNQMAEDLKSLQETVQMQNEELTSSNEELSAANEELQSANEDAQKAKEAAEKKTEQLERFNKVMVDRELRMRELKDRIKELEGKLKAS